MKTYSQVITFRLPVTIQATYDLDANNQLEDLIHRIEAAHPSLEVDTAYDFEDGREEGDS